MRRKEEILGCEGRERLDEVADYEESQKRERNANARRDGYYWCIATVRIILN